MNSVAVTVEQWKAENEHRIVQCRLGALITREACRLYQVRAGRYVEHFVGDTNPLRRMNAEYVTCAYPRACPHLMPDEEFVELRAERGFGNMEAPIASRRGDRQARLREWLASPDVMLQETDRNRSLVRKW